MSRNPKEKENFLAAFKSLAKIHKLMFTEHPTDEEIESLANECEDFLKFFPARFPKFDISRKTYTLGMILPIFIRRERGSMFKFLSAEEQGESLHKLFNEFERQYCSIPYKPMRYFLMKKAYMSMNRINVDKI